MKRPLLILLLFCSCKKSTPPTTLKVIVTDNQGMPLTNYPRGIWVYLYNSKANFGNQNLAFESAPIDVNATASFNNLSGQQYYFYVQGPCGTNSGSDSTTIGPIQGGATTSVYTVFRPIAGCTP